MVPIVAIVVVVVVVVIIIIVGVVLDRRGGWRRICFVSGSRNFLGIGAADGGAVAGRCWCRRVLGAKTHKTHGGKAIQPIGCRLQRV